jgi:hypothetical protein
MRLAIAFLFLPLLQGETVVGPKYPAQAIAGGTVVAALRVSKGAVVGIRIVQGAEPFTEPVQSALGSWHLAESENGDILVVVNFRSPTLLATGSPVRALSPPRSMADRAFPKKVVEPSYPPNSLAEGSVILKLELNETGTVSRLSVLQGLGDMTGACVAAVRDWVFQPARNNKGVSARSSAYAVCVVRRPVLPPRIPD